MERKPSSWIDAKRSLADSPAAAYLSSLGAGSRRTIQQSLATLASMLAGEQADPMKLRWEKLRRADTLALRSALQERFAPATANKILSALRGVLRRGRDLGLMKEGDFQLAATLEEIKLAKASPRIAVTDKVLSRLFAACSKDASVAGRRDAALLVVFLSSGLRRAEAAALDMADYDPASGRLHIRGERPEYDRLVALPSPARLAMRAWLEVRTLEPGPLLLPVDRGGLIRFRRMTDQAIYDIYGRIARRSGVNEVTLRDLRRAYVVSLIHAEKTLEEVQYLVGHASWVTTSAYRELATAKDAEGYDLANLPYRPPKGGKP
jgi:integrase/recombinase XerD